MIAGPCQHVRWLLQITGSGQAGEEDPDSQPSVWQWASEIRTQIWNFRHPPYASSYALQSVQGKYKVDWIPVNLNLFFFVFFQRKNLKIFENFTKCLFSVGSIRTHRKSRVWYALHGCLERFRASQTNTWICSGEEGWNIQTFYHQSSKYCSRHQKKISARW